MSVDSFKSEYGKFSTPLAKLRLGDVIWHKVNIHPDDVADPESDTAKAVKKNKPTKRLLVVLSLDPLRVAYLATFAGSVHLPTTLQTAVWYPVGDAGCHRYATSVSVQTEPRQEFVQWVNIRCCYELDKGLHMVDRIGGFHFPLEAVQQILEAMNRSITARRR
ncbi:hypothetical protein BDW22DRAFT_1426396 [Trametopsis cervina]|nr:hypothetical protein BDW22DRAFT_1426396 [Trametopsis cervina]